MKLQRKILGALLFLSLLGIKTFSQVTIGSNEKPVEGALLHLSDITGTTEGEANATKGLMLPRVKLIKNADNTNVANTINGAAGETYEPSAHIGLMVYNINNDPCPMVKSGLYVWNGDIWQPVKNNERSPLEAETATTVTDRQGNVYPIANFGAAGTWMTQNLRTTIQPGGMPVPQNLVPSNTDMYYLYPQVAGTYAPGQPDYWKPEYGLLYNWSAATNNDNCTKSAQIQTIEGDFGGSSGVQGICPFGWHIPSDGEWNQLQKVLTQQASLYSDLPNGIWNSAWELANDHRTGGIDGSVMKSKTKVKTTGNVDVSAATGGQSNASTNNGFDVFLVGSAGSSNTVDYGIQTDFWTSSVYTVPTFASLRNFTNTSPDVFRSGLVKLWYYGVRCKKD